MPRRRHSKGQFISIPREVEGELTVDENRRKHAIFGNTLYRWKKAYGSMEVNQAKELREEDAKLKKKVGGQAMEIDDLLVISSRKR